MIQRPPFDWPHILDSAVGQLKVARQNVGNWSSDNREGTLEYWTAKSAFDRAVRQYIDDKAIEDSLQKLNKPQTVPFPGRVVESSIPFHEGFEPDPEKVQELGFDDLRNGTDFEFSDISSEQWREYLFEEIVVRIDDPVALHVSKSGGHRILDSLGHSHYVPKGWILLTWEVREGENHFDF